MKRVEDVGLTFQAIFGIEGPGWLLQDKLEEPGVRERVLRVAEAVETEPTLLGASGHLLVVARKP